jgi:1-acyl-sn-glycerol-3-phosphate acyltransferase
MNDQARAESRQPAEREYPPLPPDDVFQGLMWVSVKAISRIVTTLMFDYRAYGLEHIPPKGGVLLVSNHQSFLDPVLLGVWLRRAVNFIAKVELFRGRAFGWFLRNMHVFSVRRGEGDVGAVKEAIKRLQEGRILMMFPEGTRTEDGQIRPIQPGIGMLVRRAEAAVVPAVIHGAFEAWPKGRRLFRPHRIRVMYGPPLDIGGLKGKQIVELLERTLKGMLAELKERTRRE